MARPSMKEKVDAALERLNEGVRDFFQGDHYKEYLATMSKLHHYSARNCILIERQHPGAEMVASYNSWKKNFNRQVKKGEKGIMILAPSKRTVEVDVPGKLDASGNPLKEKRDYITFRPVYVFASDQTEGDPLPELINRLDFKVDGYEKIKSALIRISDCPIIFEPMKEGDSINGFFNPMKNEIHIREGMSEAQTVKTILHEISHSLIHPATLSDKTRNEKEIEAESSAWIVCNYLFGDEADFGEYSFGYVGSWAEGKEIKELTECVENIKRASGILIERLDKELGLEIKPEEVVGREDLTAEVKQIVADAGIKAENVVIVAEQPGRMSRMVYVTNTEGTYQAAFFLHGETSRIEQLLTDKETVINDYPSFFERHDVGCVIRPHSEGQVYDYWYNYETRELVPYPEAAKKEVTAMVTVTGKSTEEQVMQLNDAMPLVVGNRISFTTVNTGRDIEISDSDVTARYEHMDSSWPMVQIRYTNVDGRIPAEMNIFEFQKMIEKQPDKVLDDPGKYFKVCISYTYLDQNHQSVQDVDLGRGRVDYLDYMKLPGCHIEHLKRHVELLRTCDDAKHFAPGTEYGMRFEDDVQEWAGFCREVLNHYSENPMFPCPPDIGETRVVCEKGVLEL
ncbi:MAG: ssDNA-binding domain-containing protein [Eubacterium sp.]|nr:ssDNA-binding domain-containing protein [Eubacterium sp.]